MRATCETCGQVQPPDWQPGDLCGSCGHVVRREQRCHWCVKMTPQGKYCRHCGAGQVPIEQYGAARWMKHVGSDQFVIPERLGAMEPDQVAHFTRLYQVQGNVVEQMVQRMQLAERYLRHQGGWALAWEDAMLPRLPMSEEQLDEWRTDPLKGTTDEEKLAEIRDTSPLELASSLASMARLRLLLSTAATFAESAMGLDFHNTRQFLDSPDKTLRAEAGLILSHWYLLVNQLSYCTEYKLRSAAAAALGGPFDAEAQICIALFDSFNQPGPQPLPPQALGNPDPDLAFAVAIATQASAALHAALRVSYRRFAAALTLTKMGDDFNLPALLPDFSGEQNTQLLWAMSRRKQARPDMHAAFRKMMTGKMPIDSLALEPLEELIVLDLRPGDAVQLMKQCFPSLIIKMLKSPTLPPGELIDICAELVRYDLFDPRKIPPLYQIIENGVLPLGFVPGILGEAPIASFTELKAVVRQQLTAHPVADVQPLHRLVRSLQTNVAQSGLVRNWANELLTVWYGGDSQKDRPALTYTLADSAPYFSDFQEFIEEQINFIDHEEDFRQLEPGYRLHARLEDVRHVDGPEPINAALATLPPALLARLCTTLIAFINKPHSETYAREGALHILNAMRFHQPWEATAQATLEGLLGGDYDYEVQRLLKGE